MPKLSQIAKRARAASIVSGITKRLPREGTYWMNGKALSHEALVAFFQAQVDALDAISHARAVLAAAVAKERAVSRRVMASLPVFQRALSERLGFKADALADFGWKVPKKPGPKTTAAKLAGVLKAQATRAARGTMGRKQKLKIRGR